MLSQRLCSLQPFMANNAHQQPSAPIKDVSAAVPNGSCRSSINAGAATAALLSTQLRKRKVPLTTLSSTSTSEVTVSCSIESKKRKSINAGNNKDDEPTKTSDISPIQFLEGLFSSISGGIDTIRNVQNLHNIKIDSTCNSSPPQCDINSYNLQMVRAVQNGDIAKMKDILVQEQKQQQLKNEQGTANAVNVFNACNRFGESLLHMACRRGQYEIVKFLLHDAAVTIDRYDDYGRTPLHDAFWTTKPNFQIADLLIRNCSPHLLVSYDVRGHTPFHYARVEHHGAWTTFLRQHRSILMQRISLYLSTVSMTNTEQQDVAATVAVQQNQLDVVKEANNDQKLKQLNLAKDEISNATATTSMNCSGISSLSKNSVKSDCAFVDTCSLPLPLNMLSPGQLQGQQPQGMPNMTSTYTPGLHTPLKSLCAVQQKLVYSTIQPSNAVMHPGLQLTPLSVTLPQQEQKQMAVLLPPSTNSQLLNSLNSAVFPMTPQQLQHGHGSGPYQNLVMPLNFFQQQLHKIHPMQSATNSVILTAPTIPSQFTLASNMFISQHPTVGQQQLSHPVLVVNNQSPLPSQQHQQRQS
jgi:ankyrin repeat protein